MSDGMSSAIQNAGINDPQEDFVFVIGENRYSCSSILARFLSPKMCLQHGVDPSIKEYVVETNMFA
jgi:hypothetical protein